MKNMPPLSLWRWLCLRILSLAIGTVVLIATCMWLRFIVWSLWVVHSMPEAVRNEFEILRANPELNRTRYYHILETWYGPKLFDLSIASEDWLILGVLVLVAIPLIVMLGLWAARPLSVQFSQLAVAAREVARGQFSTRARMVPGAPAELTLLTRDFNAMTAQLERYERELHASHVAMAHELRSPLTAAMGRLQGMLDGVFPPDTRQLQMVMNQMLNLNRLIEDLHLLSMASAGQLAIDKTRLNPVELLRDRIAWLKPNAEAAGFSVTLHADEEGYCLADPIRLGQVFTILMDNALRYAVEGKTQRIDVVRQQDRWRIQFRDYGPGVSDAFLPHIFERFSRADTSRARHSGGSGLGLSIAEAICGALGGSLTAENHPQGGMCFTLELPVA
ncbi:MULTISPECIES: sensor histidine kinase [Dickeya]|uniref:histidine kinase n=1 Tax=Dickeya zeae (strain Ech586) TaxID=590409 RepID=D2BTB5_DICZ5|nr:MULTISPECIES: ATP-binding protein [Dickeya]ACZ75752.1 integral membrane sensor signal transduction histidine kinase [Dickeya parazeae Ech586]MBP2834665.1 HAMP domain-containing protein [Dickeya parazeae]UCZ76388.1 HAMP domain-containing protein [Dickeya zeae]